MKLLFRFALSIITVITINNTAAFAGYRESDGTCASFVKTAEMPQTSPLGEVACKLIHASGTGVFQQDFISGGKVIFSVVAENYPDTEHLEYRTDDGPAFYSNEELYGYQGCYVTPKGNALLFHCFRADDE